LRLLFKHEIMVKPLSFKGDSKPKKRKRPAEEPARTTDPFADRPSTSQALVLASTENATAAPEHEEEDDTWVSADAVTDISGPVVIVLPTEPVTCLACDAQGKVFASEIENMIGADPSTAEPHDVRQVWVANRVAGTEGFSFKGHHGRCVEWLSEQRISVSRSS
jgi:protein FRG1